MSSVARIGRPRARPVQDEAFTVDALEALDAAITAIAGEASLEGVLQVIADRLRPLVGARYAALGIVGPDRRIARFITSGIDDAVAPRASGLLRGGTASWG